MKKRIAVLAILLLAALSAVGCKKKASAHVEGDLTTLMDAVYAQSGVAEWPMLVTTPITAENCSYYFGADIPMTEGLASEPIINAIPHSVCLLRVPENANVETVKETIRDHVNPNKWICVGVADNDVVVDSIGDLVILIMADESEALHESFQTLADR